MLDVPNTILWLAAVIALAFVIFSLRGYFTTEARTRRRREKSHKPLASRKQGPAVRLAVDVDESKRGRKH